MIKFRNCPRCMGDLYLSQDIYGKFYSCIQCGYLRDVVEIDASRFPSGQKAEILNDTGDLVEAERDAA